MTRGLARVLAPVVLVGLTSLAAPAADRVKFDGAAALKQVERLVAIGPRAAGTPGGVRARAYIAGELKKIKGVRVEVRPFEADTPHGRLAMANVVAVVPGRRPDVIMLAGHYDTKFYKEFRFVGANDGGSSTALLIELARRLAVAPRDYTYWLVWFDGEEARVTWTERDSLYGSRRLAAELARAKQLPRAMILVDMIGERGARFLRESDSTTWLKDVIWGTAAELGHGGSFPNGETPITDDHYPFLQAGVDAVDIIDIDYQPWHTAGDTIDKLSARSLEIVGEVLLAALPKIEARLGG